MPKSVSRTDPADLVADSVGRLMEFWGFKRTMGRIWATLYLAPEPLPAAELCSRLGISAGAASMTLGELERWGVVQRLFRPGERREYFQAETNLWKMISRVYEERERREIERLIDALGQAVAAMEAELAKSDAAPVRFALGRARRLLSLARFGHQLVNAFLSGGATDLDVLRHEDLSRPGPAGASVSDPPSP